MPLLLLTKSTTMNGVTTAPDALIAVTGAAVPSDWRECILSDTLDFQLP